jgi:GNAT superfamily N-acetyltransferase
VSASAASAFVRPIRDDEREELGRLVAASQGSAIIISREASHDVRELPALVAVDLATGHWLGTAAYRFETGACELVAIQAFERGAGIGTALLDAVAVAARAEGATRLWLITTNDNVDALRFYQRRGFHLVRVWRDAVTRSRVAKPQIPLRGDYDIPIRDEVELELDLGTPEVIRSGFSTDSSDGTEGVRDSAASGDARQADRADKA